MARLQSITCQWSVNQISRQSVVARELARVAEPAYAHAVILYVLRSIKVKVECKNNGVGSTETGRLELLQAVAAARGGSASSDLLAVQTGTRSASRLRLIVA